MITKIAFIALKYKLAIIATRIESIMATVMAAFDFLSIEINHCVLYTNIMVLIIYSAKDIEVVAGFVEDRPEYFKEDKLEGVMKNLLAKVINSKKEM